MKKEDLDQLSFKKKSEYLTAIFNEYRLAKLSLSNDIYGLKSHFPLMIGEGNTPVNEEHRLLESIQRHNRNRTMVEFIDHCLICLPEMQRLIILKDFVNERQTGWWMADFSKSTYYRLKKQAMNQLLALILL